MRADRDVMFVYLYYSGWQSFQVSAASVKSGNGYWKLSPMLYSIWNTFNMFVVIICLRSINTFRIFFLAFSLNEWCFCFSLPAYINSTWNEIQVCHYTGFKSNNRNRYKKENMFKICSHLLNSQCDHKISKVYFGF